MNTDRLVKEVLLKSSLERVWNALTDSNEFGSWFGMKLEGPFRAGQLLRGHIAPTSVDPEVAKMQKPYEGTAVVLWIERIEPKTLFSFQWHPYAVDLNTDYSKEPRTTVTFALKEESGGVRLTITESGFEDLPISRRNEALKSNEGGWEAQTQLIAKYLSQNAK
jgi:uncharacterized protein YndB with AHSA1/START domain